LRRPLLQYIHVPCRVLSNTHLLTFEAPIQRRGGSAMGACREYCRAGKQSFTEISSSSRAQQSALKVSFRSDYLVNKLLKSNGVKERGAWADTPLPILPRQVADAD
jgi:hypothetical protein